MSRYTGRRYLRKWEIKRFIGSYIYGNPFDLFRAMISARPDLRDNKRLSRKEIEKMGEVVLSNKMVNTMVSDEFAKILKDGGIENAKKKFLNTILKAEELAVDSKNSSIMLDIAKMWGQMSAEYGLKHTVTQTQEINGKLSDETLKQLKSKAKITETIETGD